MRKFKITHPTTLKLGTTAQSSALSPQQTLAAVEGTILECDDLVLDAGNKHFKLMTELTIYGGHIEEVEPEYLVTAKQAKAVYGRDLTSTQLEDLNACLKRFNITTSQRIRHFLSQTAHESGGLRWLVELGNRNYFKKYEWRRDLGNNRQGDGYKFRGAGAIQLTGRTNYKKLFDWTKDNNVMTKGADYVMTAYPFTSAGVWWAANKMNSFIDRGATVRQVTRRVNGGYNGLRDREHYYKKACQVIL